MSLETIAWLNTQTLIGYTDSRGFAWHYRAESQGQESNHYAGAIPVSDVLRRLFDWQALETELYVRAGGSFVAVPERKAIVRGDTYDVLGIFKSGYTAHQYDKWLLENVATILDADLGIGSAGLLKGGAVAWVSVEVPDSITTPEGVVFRPNLLATTSFDGSIATTYKRVVQNVVCDNTLSAGLREHGQTFKAKHTRNSGMKIGAAREALAIVHTIADDFAAEVAELCAIEVSRKTFGLFLEAYVPLEEGASKRSQGMAEGKREELTRLYTADARCAPWTGTAYGVLQTVNTFRHHSGIVRGMNRAQRNMLNAVDGTTETEDVIALDTLSKVLESTAA